MIKNKQSRRDFLFLTGNEPQKQEMIKMLTSDGKLVEVNKDIVLQASNHKRASNKEILDWMNNPSKEIK